MKHFQNIQRTNLCVVLWLRMGLWRWSIRILFVAGILAALLYSKSAAIHDSTCSDLTLWCLLCFAFFPFFPVFILSLLSPPLSVELESFWHFLQKSGSGFSPSFKGWSWWYFFDLILPHPAHICLVIVIVVFVTSTLVLAVLFGASGPYILLKCACICCSWLRSCCDGFGKMNEDCEGYGTRFGEE